MLLLLLSLASTSALCENTESTENLEKPFMLSVFDHTNLDLSAYVGKALYIYFFSEAYPVSIEEIPTVKQVAEAYDPDELQVLFIHAWVSKKDTAKTCKNLIEAYGMQDYTFFEDKKKTVCKVLALPSYPVHFFIDKNGYLQDALVRSLEFDAIAEVIDSMDVLGVNEERPTEEPTATPGPTPTPAPPQGIQIGRPGAQTATPTALPSVTPSPTTPPQKGTPSPFVTKAPAPTKAPSGGDSPNGSSGGAPLGSHGVVN